tara:strand:+ start:95 stop:781 length:687 start_codon:yes stop_codon:yes gene_type:complete
MPHQINHNLDPFLPKPGGNIDAKSTMPALGTLSSVAEAASNVAGIAGTLGKAGKAAGAAGKAAGAINPVGLAMMGLDMGIKGFTAGKAAKDDGASTGGTILEGVLGTVGLEGLYEDPAIKAAKKAEEVKKAGIASASNQLTKNTMEMQKEDYSNVNEDGTMATKKSLAAMTGTVAHNMSAAQYKSAVKFNGIAMKLADKDYDGDGKIESSKEEYFGSRDNAIKENKNK